MVRSQEPGRDFVVSAPMHPRFRRLFAAGAIAALPIVLSALTWYMQGGDVWFSGFLAASFSPKLTEVARLPWPWHTGNALAFLAAVASLLLKRDGPLRCSLRISAFAICTVVLGVMISGLAVPCARWWWRERRLEEAIGTAERTHPWAGRYYLGDGVGANVKLTLSPDGAYLIKSYGCTGHQTSEFGTVAPVANEVRLQPHRSHRDEVWGLETLYVLTWGERRYLVPDAQWGSFCSAVHDGSEPRRDIHGTTFLREDDWRRETSGPPPLPARVASCLTGRPGVARIVGLASLSWRFLSDGGVAQGFWEGRKVILRAPDGTILPGVVHAVESKKSMVELDEEDRGRVHNPPVAIGWAVIAQ